jgi:hypothetical protein
MALSLAEETVLLGLDEDTGKLLSFNISYALSAAILAELVLVGRIAVNAGEVRVIDQRPAGDAVLDEALRHIAASGNRSLPHWIRTEPAEHQRNRILDRLVQAGVLDRVEKHALGLFPYRRYPAHDFAIENEIRNRLRTAALGGASSDRTRLLLSIADACGLTPRLLTKAELKAAKPVIEELTAADPIGAAVREAIREDQAAILLTGAAN